MKNGTSADVLQNETVKPLASPTKKKSPGARKFHDSWQLLILLAPLVIYYILFSYIPLWGISVAFMDYRPFKGITDSKWVGMQQFQRFFGDPNSWKLIKNTFLLSFYDLVISFPFTIFFALIVNDIRNEKVKKGFQTVTYLPHFISTVVIVGMMKNFLNPDTGLIMNFLANLGMKRIDMFAYARFFRRLYILSGIWAGTGWGAIIYYAALSNVDQEMYEAAVIDGANKLHQVWYITLPSIAPTIVTMFILRTGSLLSVGFEKAYMMQTSATLSVSDVISTYTYRQGLAGGQFSYATAVGIFNSVVNLLFLIGANTISRKFSESSLW